MKKLVLSLMLLVCIAFNNTNANTPVINSEVNTVVSESVVYEVKVELKWAHNGDRVDPEDYQECLSATNFVTGETVYACDRNLTGTFAFELEEGFYTFNGGDYYFVGVISSSRLIEEDTYLMLELWSE